MNRNQANQRLLTYSKEALLKSYQIRLKENVESMLENFEGILIIINFILKSN